MFYAQSTIYAYIKGDLFDIIQKILLYSFFEIGFRVIVQELCESRGGRPGLSVLTSRLVSVDVKIY